MLASGGHSIVIKTVIFILFRGIFFNVKICCGSEKAKKDSWDTWDDCDKIALRALKQQE